MKRQAARKQLCQIIRQGQQRGYDHWNQWTYPLVEELSVDDEILNVEYVLLENEIGYMHIAVSVSRSSLLDEFMPISGSFIVKRI